MTDKRPDLAPRHLSHPQESAADLRAQAQEAAAPEPDADDGEKKKMEEREYTFAFRHVTKSRVYEGTFTHTVPNGHQRRAIGILRAKLGGGQPLEALDGLTNDLNVMLAHLDLQLSEKERPDWAQDLGALVDLSPLYKLWEVVSLHEATFRG